MAIAEGRIAYVGQSAAHCIGEDTRVIDAAGQVIAPGFLDGHIHVESSMIGAGEYARAVIPTARWAFTGIPTRCAMCSALKGCR